MMNKPYYKHDCSACIFLGNYAIPDIEETYDLYWCPQMGTPTVIARYGNDDPEYSSGMPMDSIFYDRYPAYSLHEAYRRAKDRGLEVRELRPLNCTFILGDEARWEILKKRV